jgi:demethylmenaquinone methyltransferase/2-methoxy-6-polyprenyl-1,4-benzoquinol methylase
MIYDPARPDSVRAMFSRIAPRYDLANTLLSFGRHHLWRRELVRRSGAGTDAAVLDCATGTGDLAFEFKRAVGPAGTVAAVDFSQEMLDVARTKALDQGLVVDFLPADASRLPFPDGRFDVAAIAFGIRNVRDPGSVLKELARVVRRGGSVMVLEFGRPEGALRGPLFRFYASTVMPAVGGWVTGDREAYRYLDRTAAAFPYGKAFVQRLRETDSFDRVEAFSLSGGVAWIYRALVGPSP